MNRLLGLGLLSLVGTLFVACDDTDSSSNNPTGSAGSGGTGGSGGGSSDIVTTTPNNTPAFTGIATCSGCVEVEVPVTGGNSEENLQDQVGFAFFVQGMDLTNAVVTWRVMALENNADLMVAPYAENGDPYPGAYRLQAALSEANFPPGMWVDVAFDLSAHPAFGADAGVVGDAGSAVTITLVDAGADSGTVAVPTVAVDAGAAGDAGLISDAGVSLDAGASSTDAPTPAADLAASFVQPLNLAFDKSNVSQLALYVGSGPDLVGDAVAKIVIDSVRFTGVTDIPDVTFDDSIENFMRNTFNEPTGTQGPLWHP